MRARIREVLRLYFAAALSIRAIARSLGTSPSTVGDYLRRAKVAGLSWPLPESVDDARLERRLFPVSPPSRTARPLPDWSEVHRELRRKNVTLSLLWGRSTRRPTRRGCSTAGSASSTGPGPRSSTWRQEHRAGEKAVRRLRRADGAGGSTGKNRRGASGADFRGRARGLELHLRRGDVYADPAGLDGIARARLRILRRVYRAGGARQSALGGQPRPSLRAGPESDLSRPRPRVRRPKTRRRRRSLFKSSSSGYSRLFTTARSSR